MYEKYRRLYPRIRLSWTCYHLWKSGNITGVWKYLTETESYESPYMSNGKELHRVSEGKLMLDMDVSPQEVLTENDCRTELILDGIATVIGVPDKLLVFNDRPAILIDYKSGKIYPYYTDQIFFYATIIKMEKNINVGRGYIIPIKWNDAITQSVLNGSPKLVIITDKRIAEMYEDIQRCAYDIAFRIDCGELDDFISFLSSTQPSQQSPFQ